MIMTLNFLGAFRAGPNRWCTTYVAEILQVVLASVREACNDMALFTDLRVVISHRCLTISAHRCILSFCTSLCRTREEAPFRFTL